MASSFTVCFLLCIWKYCDRPIPIPSTAIPYLTLLVGFSIFSVLQIILLLICLGKHVSVTSNLAEFVSLQVGRDITRCIKPHVLPGHPYLLYLTCQALLYVL